MHFSDIFLSLTLNVLASELLLVNPSVCASPLMCPPATLRRCVLKQCLYMQIRVWIKLSGSFPPALQVLYFINFMTIIDLWMCYISGTAKHLTSSSNKRIKSNIRSFSRKHTVGTLGKNVCISSFIISRDTQIPTSLHHKGQKLNYQQFW